MNANIFTNSRAHSGALEGMPLYLIIIVVIAVAVLGIVLGWIFLASDTDPMIDKIEVAPEEVSLSGTGTPEITVTVWDTEGDKVRGVVIEVKGCNVNIDPTKLESGTGTIQLTGCDLPPDKQSDFIQIVAKKSGMGTKTFEVLVVQTIT